MSAGTVVKIRENRAIVILGKSVVTHNVTADLIFSHTNSRRKLATYKVDGIINNQACESRFLRDKKRIMSILYNISYMSERGAI